MGQNQHERPCSVLQSPHTLLPFIHCKSHQSAQATKRRRTLDTKMPVAFLVLFRNRAGKTLLYFHPAQFI